MTKKKQRFKLDSEVGFIDTQKCAGDTMTHFEVVVELNKLNEENEQLEKSIEQLRTIIDDNIDFNTLFTNRELNDICNETGWELSEKSIKLQQLEKENEQLKKENKTLADGLTAYFESKIKRGDVE